MSPSGAVSILHSFTGADGRAPTVPLLQAADGNFYGTAAGGSFNEGVVFKVTSDGSLTVLHNFAGGEADGAQPLGALVQAPDGVFYSTTKFGGSADTGTIFRMSLSGTVTVLHAFGPGPSAAAPSAPLLQAADGNFYGTSAAGGSRNLGTVFRIAADGKSRILHSF